MTLQNRAVAILAAGGVNQNDISYMQRLLIQKRCFPKIVGVGARLITSWNNGEWGHNFAVDAPIAEVLGVDYDILIIPGGERSLTALAGTEHTARILRSFMAAGKPVILMGDAATIPSAFGLAADAATVHCVEEVTEDATAAALAWAEDILAAGNGIDGDQIAA